MGSQSEESVDESLDICEGLVPVSEKRTTSVVNSDGVKVSKEKIVGKFRACIRCHLVASERQFIKHGCPNCPFYNIHQKKSALLDYTTSKYSGLLAVMQPKISWAADFNRLNKYIPGCYAIEVYGDLPETATDLLP